MRKLPKSFMPDEYSTAPEIIYTNASPAETEEENPNSEVKSYFMPEAFDWVNKKRAGLRKKNLDCVAMRQKRFVIYEEAAEMLKLKTGDRISIGVNKKYILIAKDEKSEIQCVSNSTWSTRKTKEGKKEYITVITSSVRLLREVLKKYNWPETFTINVKLQNNMLVGKKPEVDVKEIPIDQGQTVHPWRSKKTMSKEEFREKILAGKTEKKRGDSNYK